MRRVKRHIKASKNARRKVRSLHSRKHQKLIKVGGGFNAFDYVDDIDSEPTRYSTPKLETGTAYVSAYVLYDKIQSNFKYEKNEKYFINVPICVIFIVPKTFSVDDIYLFFNKNMKADDIKLTVQLLLGIDPKLVFNLTPDIPTPSTDTINGSVLGTFISNTFVKLTSCGKLSPKTFCLETGTLSDNIELDKVNTTRYKIETTNTTYKSLNGQKIKEFLASSNPAGFTKKVLDSKEVLPNLYKNYFIKVSEEVPELSEDEINEYYGNDLEPKEEPWDKKDTETYDAFKERMKKYIREKILNARKHKTYGLDSNSVEILNKNRPLNITDPIVIKYLKLDAKQIIESIEYNCKIPFTDLLINWWVDKENEEVKQAKQYVDKRKRARTTPCVDMPTSTTCHHFNGIYD